jgi:hypothetical protein
MHEKEKWHTDKAEQIQKAQQKQPLDPKELRQQGINDLIEEGKTREEAKKWLIFSTK